MKTGNGVRMPKNVVICCDGTGNGFGDENSNAVKPYATLEIDDDQVGYYHREWEQWVRRTHEALYRANGHEPKGLPSGLD